MAAAAVVPLPALKLPSGPSPMTAEQRYWKSFKNQVLMASPTGAAVTHLSCTSEALAVTTGTRVQIYSTRTRRLVKTLTRFGDVARSGELRRDGKVLAAGDDGGRVQVLDVHSRAVLRSWGEHGGQPVWATRWAPAGLTTLLSAGDDGAVRLWDLAAGAATATLAGHGDYVRCADFMPGAVSHALVSGCYDGTVRLWDPRLRPARAAVMAFRHAAPVEAVLPLPAATAVLAAAGSAVSVLDVVAARPRRLLAGHQKTVTALALAEGGRRLLTGGLEGHVKVFETTGWNVVCSTKYQSPVLAVLVVPSSAAAGAGAATTGATTATTSSFSSAAATATAAAVSSASASAPAPGAAFADRHLAVGMQSGVLSLRTRQTGAEAARARARDREMAALLGGTSTTAATTKRKRIKASSAALDDGDDAPDVVIADASSSGRRGAKERPWQRLLRHARYGRALDLVLDRAAPDYSPLQALTLLLALRHRSAVRDALEARDDAALLPVVRWAAAHVCDPRYVSACVELALHLVDLYAPLAAASAPLRLAFRTLHARVRQEVERAQIACSTAGMLDSLVLGAAAR